MLATKVVLCLAVAGVSCAQVLPNAAPHEYAYGVQTDQGDVKEHKQATDGNGRQEGEYRWLMPDGLFKVVRWSVQGDSGFVADVSEEPGQRAVGNYYFNSLSGEGAGQGNAPVISAPVRVSAPASFSAPVFSAPQPLPPVLQAVQPVQPVQTFIRADPQPSFSQGSVIDGGIIDGGIIDGGFIN